MYLRKYERSANALKTICIIKLYVRDLSKYFKGIRFKLMISKLYNARRGRLRLRIIYNPLEPYENLLLRPYVTY